MRLIVRCKLLIKFITRCIETFYLLFTARFRKADIAIFHKFLPPPQGGGNQFLSALKSEFENQGFVVEINRISYTTKICLFNSYNFDFDRLRKLQRTGCKMIHRVDGPLGVYRQTNLDNDWKINKINNELANVTIFQSKYSLNKHKEFGMKFVNPCVIHNSVDQGIFNRLKKHSFKQNSKVRLITTSWSDNINKGFNIYKWLGQNLNWDKYEYTFVGRSPIKLCRIKIIPPCPSIEVASYLKSHDVFIMASKYESCPNSVIEALACGLPVVYLDSGATSEIVKDGGLSFTIKEMIINRIETIVNNYSHFQSKIQVDNISKVADKYLKSIV